ncbi:LysR substrate-binding domain-containing protein [Actinacidiphila yeochonensis]|uniref:LysR substrate-binding domain-containing protein n=1 Tax=Actinacidiphila yeochonensis TaxID=89050 RepID=UPI0005684E4E|nr:LysR substrate-binding domain-containing protein [Actinacidiphila yeochonensis]
MTDQEPQPPFRLAYVPGATPAKWVGIWRERLPHVPLDLVAVPAAEAPAVLLAGGAEAGIVRLPVDRTALSAIPLYTEATVVVVPKDHVVSAVDEVAVADLADEVVLHPMDDVLPWERPPGRPALERPATTEDAIELVAAGIGLLVVPQSLARLHHRRDLVYRPVVDAPGSDVALSWPEDRHTDLVEQFIGIVRGRTVNSTRGRPQQQPPSPREQSAEGRPRRSASGAPSGRSGGAKGGAKGSTKGGARGASGTAKRGTSAKPGARGTGRKPRGRS